LKEVLGIDLRAIPSYQVKKKKEINGG